MSLDSALDISAYRYLWDGSEPGWVLHRVQWKSTHTLVPYNKETKSLLKIDDQETAKHVALRMKFGGVPVVDTVTD